MSLAGLGRAHAPAGCHTKLRVWADLIVVLGSPKRWLCRTTHGPCKANENHGEMPGGEMGISARWVPAKKVAVAVADKRTAMPCWVAETRPPACICRCAGSVLLQWTSLADAVAQRAHARKAPHRHGQNLLV